MHPKQNSNYPKTFVLLFLLTTYAGFSGSVAQALDQIVRPWQGVRSAGMGGVRLLTSQYDESFFGNAARHAHNPTWKVETPINLTGEVGAGTISTASTVISGFSDSSGLVGSLLDLVGVNNHVRIQNTFPGVYMPDLFRVSGNPISINFALTNSLQGDVGVRKNMTISPQFVVDNSFHVAFAGRFLPREELSLGVDTHFDHRIATGKPISILTLFQSTSGTGLEAKDFLGEGGQVELDLGGEYILPWSFEVNTDVVVGASLVNLLGGKYTSVPIKIMNDLGDPPANPTAFGFGVAIRRPSLSILDESVVSIEISDIGNNNGGNFFRMLHLGAETRLSVLSLRAGINQGYLAAGAGLDLKILSLDAATYGEELTLVTGRFEDRRYIGRLSIHL
ncbi:MAG: hypothetical protein AAB425_10415 [Bdellovibrionota bacterium]